MPLRKDIWRVGIVRAEAPSLRSAADLQAAEVVWLPPEPPLRFLADPFGLWRDGRLHVFLETYDYRDRVGAIEVLVFDAALRLLDRRPALREPWHLSYPFVFEADGETWMLPEAFKSGRLTLYRAADFPTRWSPVCAIELDQTPIDATPFHHGGLWWLFYTPATSKAAKVGALHLAHAPSLTGPWTPHRGNPVRLDPGSSRPGGRAIVTPEGIILPVQDCRRTYGGAIRWLNISRLTPEGFEAEAGEPIVAPPAFGAYRDGLHTLSAAGPVTLIDAKRFELSAATLGLDAARRVRKLASRGP